MGFGVWCQPVAFEDLFSQGSGHAAEFQGAQGSLGARAVTEGQLGQAQLLGADHAPPRRRALPLQAQQLEVLGLRVNCV